MITRPLKYAQAGIPHYWRVEESQGLPVVYVAVPFPVDIDLTAIDRRR